MLSDLPPPPPPLPRPSIHDYDNTRAQSGCVSLRVRLGQAMALIIGAPTPPICLSFVRTAFVPRGWLLFSVFHRNDTRWLILEAVPLLLQGGANRCFALTMVTFNLLEDWFFDIPGGIKKAAFEGCLVLSCNSFLLRKTNRNLLQPRGKYPCTIKNWGLETKTTLGTPWWNPEASQHQSDNSLPFQSAEIDWSGRSQVRRCMYQGRVCLSEVWPDRITLDDHNAPRVGGTEEFSLSLSPSVVAWHRSSRERSLTMPLRHELAHTLTYTRYTVLSCTIFYRLLFVLCGLCAFPLHLSPLASIKAAPASYWNQTADSREESTLFRARLQDLLMVMGARLACQPKLRRLPALAFRGAINVEGAGLS